MEKNERKLRSFGHRIPLYLRGPQQGFVHLIFSWKAIYRNNKTVRLLSIGIGSVQIIYARMCTYKCFGKMSPATKKKATKKR